VFVSANQLYIFLACICCGAIIGMFFSPYLFLRRFVKIKLLKIILDILYFVLSSFFYVCYSSKMKFPSIRFFMPFGVLFGLICYMKSFHIILAKILKKLYNLIDYKIRLKNK
jgi:hypothetical protein